MTHNIKMFNPNRHYTLAYDMVRGDREFTYGVGGGLSVTLSFFSAMVMDGVGLNLAFALLVLPLVFGLWAAVWEVMPRKHELYGLSGWQEDAWVRFKQAPDSVQGVLGGEKKFHAVLQKANDEEVRQLSSTIKRLTNLEARRLEAIKRAAPERDLV